MVYPVTHSHMKESPVMVHISFSPQGLPELVHPSISEIKEKIVKVQKEGSEKKYEPSNYDSDDIYVLSVKYPYQIALGLSVF